VHAIVTQILLDWCATATGQTPGEVLQRLALPPGWPGTWQLDTWLGGEPGPAPGQT